MCRRPPPTAGADHHGEDWRGRYAFSHWYGGRPLPRGSRGAELASRSFESEALTTARQLRGPAPLLHLPNYAVTAFGERLDRHGGEPGFTAVLAYADRHPVGCAYGNTIEHGDRYGQRTSPAPADKYTERPAVAPELLQHVRYPGVLGSGLGGDLHRDGRGGVGGTLRELGVCETDRGDGPGSGLYVPMVEII